MQRLTKGLVFLVAILAIGCTVAEMLAIALLALSHPATMHPIARIATKKTRP